MMSKNNVGRWKAWEHRLFLCQIITGNENNTFWTFLPRTNTQFRTHYQKWAIQCQKNKIMGPVSNHKNNYIESMIFPKLTLKTTRELHYIACQNKFGKCVTPEHKPKRKFRDPPLLTIDTANKKKCIKHKKSSGKFTLDCLLHVTDRALKSYYKPTTERGMFIE